MKITPTILSIPPYISTSWTFVAALYMEDSTLIISLKDGDIIEVPGLPPAAINAIFDAHAESLEKPQPPAPSPFFPPIGQVDPSFENQLRLGFNFGEGMMNATEHNPAQANTPDLPMEVLNKITAITKIIMPEEGMNLPGAAEPHCNCVHCQVVRAMGADIIHVNETEEKKEAAAAPEVSPWVIDQKDENLYTVTSKSDPKEQYNVFLGDPVGCTCGKQGCAHVIAVLKS